MSKKRESFFWISYSDLMTSMFFIMLLLFVLSTAGMYLSKHATESQLKKIQNLETAVNKLDRRYFMEDVKYKRWVLKEQINFPTGSAKMPDRYKESLIKVGQSLQKLLNDLNEMKNQPEYRDMDITYLVVIEGMASNLRDGYKYNDRLSYGRALSLYKLWRANGISFERSKCDVQIAGSGIRGLGRYNRDGKHLLDEWRNQRIIIQIIPKIGNLNK